MSRPYRAVSAPWWEPLEARLLLAADVVISEIFYQSYTELDQPEDVGEEWIELYNRGDAPADLLGWRISAGVDFTFPAATLQPGQYLVVTANPDVFHTEHPTVANYIAAYGWEGRLSNSGERIELENAAGQKVDEVQYADEGDWSTRVWFTDTQYDTPTLRVQGYEWLNLHDGGGKSLELINPAMPNNCGQNWSASLPDGGTPGAPNSVAAVDIAPLIRDVKHWPAIPRPQDPIHVQARITDELATGLSVRLYYREDGDPDFTSIVMQDNGLGADEQAGDGVYVATLDANTFAHGTIVEFYVQARDAGGRMRTWPAPVQGAGQVANCLLQVDQSFDPNAAWTPGGKPIFRVILTGAEWNSLNAIENDANASHSDVQKNITFIAVDGTGIDVRYQAGMRNRGNGSRHVTAHNQRINFASDRPWRGATSINLNAQRPYAQVIGSAIFRYADLPAADATPVKMLINGVDRSDQGSDMYGYYNWLEDLGSDLVANHWPADDAGNLYKVNYFSGSGDDNELEYWGENPDLYRNYYNKQTNVAEDDYGDLIHMLYVLNNAPAATYLQDVSEVIDVDQWIRYLSLHDFLANTEGGLLTGGGDDFVMYRGVADPRFQMAPYDLDSILTWGGSTTNPLLGNYAGVIGLSRLLSQPEVIQKYYAALLEYCDTVFSPAVFNPLVDQVLGGWRDATAIQSAKDWVASRVAFVRANVPNAALTVQTNLPTTGGVPTTTSQLVNFSGTAGTPYVRSVTVNGRLAQWNPANGTWTYDGAGDYSERTLLTSNSAVAYHVPLPGEDVTSWTATGYSDASWVKSVTLNGAGVLITEVATDGTRFVEVQNVSTGAVDTGGWQVLANSASGGINAANAIPWSLPASVAAGQVLYRTDSAADNYWGSPIDWSPTGSGWVMIVDDAGTVRDFLAWGYTAAQIAGMDVDFGAFTGLNPSGQWSGDGAPVGTTGGGGGTTGWVAFNDHIRGTQTHANTTTYDAYPTSADPASGLLKDIATGANTAVTLTVTHSGVNFQGSQDRPATGTDAYNVFNGYVDLGNPGGSDGDSLELQASNNDFHLYTFSGLDTTPGVTYSFTGTAVRGNSSYYGRWTLVTLEGAVSFTPAHSTGIGVVTSAVNPALAANQVAIWTGHNSTVSQGWVAAWTNIDPGPDGVFAVRSQQYVGPTPGVGSDGQAGNTATSEDEKGYGISGVRLEEVRPSGPQSWLQRKGNTDLNTAANFERATADTKGGQNPKMTVPFGTQAATLQGVGFHDNQPAFGSVIRTDVGAAMEGVNASLWTRMTFTGGSLTGYERLILRIRYDDGFIAYLNGVEVARRNADNPLAWNMAASGEHDNAQAVLFEQIDITPYLHLLGSGTNVLAIHGLNLAAGDADFLSQAELVISRGTPGAGMDFLPGMNRVVVKAFDGPFGTGEELASRQLDVWYDSGPTNVYPQQPPGAAGGATAGEQPAALSVHLQTRDSYLPGVPVVVRVEVLDETGAVYRDLWDATATLTVDNPDVQLSTSLVTLYNGLGTALVTFTKVTGDIESFNLTATVNGLSDTDDLIDLTGTAMMDVSGTISDPSGTITWSGIVHVTGGLTVPAGQTLSVQPGTLVLIDGVTSGTNGTVITVQGGVQSLGTEDSPVTWTAYAAGTHWGQMLFSSAAPSLFQYTDVTRGGRSPAVGHSNTGPTFRTSGACSLTLDHANLTDELGKIMYGPSGPLDLTFRDSVLARSVMGPEIWPRNLLIEDTWITDMHAGDDADGIYVRGATGQNARMTGGVSAVGDDDGIDTLDAVLVIEDRIIRDMFDKAVSAYDGTVTIQWCLLVDNGTDSEDGTSSTVSAKAYANHSVTVNIDHTTIVTTRQAGITDVGIEARWKYSDAYPVTITYRVTNSIIDATRPVQNDYADPTDPFNQANPNHGSTIVLDNTYTNFHGTELLWGTSGAGNLSADPLFADAANRDYRLQTASPCINAGDPGFPADADGSTTDQGRYTNNAFTIVQGELTGNTVWGPQDGQFRITGELTVPAQYTLTILPGTTVFFDTGARLIVKGRLAAEGTADAPIRFTRRPGGGNWAGIRFVDSVHSPGNVIRHAILEYVDDDEGIVGLTNSELTVEGCTFDNARRRRIASHDSSLIVRGCVFTDVWAAGQTPFDNRSEHIWGGGIPPGGHLIIEGNTFGRTPGHNDAIDFDGGHEAAGYPVIQILRNTFLGGGDDALDLEGDALIEGNVFGHYHKDSYNLDPGNSNVISAGDAHNVGHRYVVVNNIFHDVDHVSVIKDQSTMTFAHNTVADCSGPALYFYLAGQVVSRGRGADVDGSIFWNTPTIFAGELAGQTTVTADYSRVNAADVARGAGNIADDPAFMGPAGELSLFAGSPCVGAALFGMDMGAYVPAGAGIGGGPHDLTYLTDATFEVGGNAVAAFKWRLNGGAWSAEQVPGTQVVLGGLSAGPQLLQVISRSFAGVWQTADQATSRSWTVDPALSRVLINEVLAGNRTAHLHDGLYPDTVELYNDSPTPTVLTGWSISDDPDDPTKYRFAAGTTIGAESRLLLYAADAPAAGATGIYLGFKLDADGEGVWLYNAAGQLVDSIRFGMQIADLSIGRVGPDRRWALNQPTLGGPNVRQPTAPPTGVRINEWFTNGDVVLKDDFIELYNPHALPVDLEGLYLTDNPANQKTKHRFGAFDFVPAEGFRAVKADDRDDPGHVDFRLSALMEILGLFDADLGQMDRIYYGPQTTDVSQGRTPDGSDTTQFFTLPTPNTGNVTRGSSSTTTQTLVAETALKYVLVPTGDIGTAWRTSYTYDTSGWSSFSGSPTGVGFDFGSSPTYLPLIGLNVNTAMNGGGADRNTCYLRVPFTFTGDKADIDALSLNVRYDDGFIAYLNGTWIASANAPPSPAYNSSAAGSHSDSAAVTLVPFDVTAYLGALQQGGNLLAFQAMDATNNSTDFLFAAELVATATTWQDGGFENLLALHNDLRITEVMYNPDGKDDTEFIELLNTGGSTLHLGGVRLTGDVEFIFPEMDLAPGEYVVVVANLAKFRAWYGSGPRVAGAYDPQRLPNDRGEIVLQMPEPYEAAILRFEYDQDWYVSTDGDGPSLAIRDQGYLRPRWRDRDAWQPSGVAGGSPGADDPAPQHPVNAVVINEVLAHSNYAPEDWVELLNTTDEPIDISGWFLSDNPAAPQKYVIPPGTILAPGEHKVFNQVDHFGSYFGLSELGDEVVLTSCDVNGNLGTYRAFAVFGATDPDVSVGRYLTTAGRADFVAMSSQTYGLPNAAPRVGPIVIEEIMYNPPEGEYEYILLRNITGAAVPLYDPENPANTWRFDDGVLFTFPQGVVVPPGGYLLVVGVDEASYRAKYGVQDEVQVFGPFDGALSNSGETVTLMKPGRPETLPEPFVPYVIAESVRYADDLPWPGEPDGTGPALSKLNLAGYGNDPSNWGACPAPLQQSWSVASNGDVCRPELVFHFSRSVLVDLDGVELLNGGETPLGASYTITGRGTDTLVVSFDVPDAPLAYGGPYTLRFGGAGVSDLAGRIPVGWSSEVTFAAALDGDADLDRVVGLLDYLLLKENYGKRDAGWTDCDFNYDGVVNRADLLKLKGQYGAVYPAPAPAGPDPAAAGQPPLAGAEQDRQPLADEPVASPAPAPTPEAPTADPPAASEPVPAMALAGAEPPQAAERPAADAPVGDPPQEAPPAAGRDAPRDALAAIELLRWAVARSLNAEAPVAFAPSAAIAANDVADPGAMAALPPLPAPPADIPADALAATSPRTATAAGTDGTGMVDVLVDVLAACRLTGPLA